MGGGEAPSWVGCGREEADGGIASACFAKLILANVADEDFVWRGTVLE